MACGKQSLTVSDLRFFLKRCGFILIIEKTKIKSVLIKNICYHSANKKSYALTKFQTNSIY